MSLEDYEKLMTEGQRKSHKERMKIYAYCALCCVAFWVGFFYAMNEMFGS